MAEPWLELSTVCEPEAADAVAEVFGRFGRGVAIDQPVLNAPDGDGGWVDPTRNVVVKTYLPLDEECEERRQTLAEAVWHLGRLRHVEPLQTVRVDEEDWANAWKRFFFPHRVGERIVIVPSWRRRKPRPNDLVIRLDPGMAFGTGLHPTTRMCLAELERLVSPGDTVLDFGCGSAILSIAAARLGATRVRGYEIDSVAARVAVENVRRNHVIRTVAVTHGSIAPDDRFAGQYDVIAANISAFVLTRERGLLFQLARPGATAVLSGVLERDEPTVRASFVEAGWEHLATRIEADWTAIVIRRPAVG
ncbi:MAG: 50S ribosomal protein L11 methyltransferase [Chloroflexota bacterium]